MSQNLRYILFGYGFYHHIPPHYSLFRRCFLTHRHILFFFFSRCRHGTQGKTPRSINGAQRSAWLYMVKNTCHYIDTTHPKSAFKTIVDPRGLLSTSLGQYLIGRGSQKMVEKLQKRLVLHLSAWLGRRAKHQS